MSVELEWTALDGILANAVVEILNRHLANAARPSFIGPIEIISLDFGSTPPDIDIVDIRDIYRDFLESDEDVDMNQTGATKVGQTAGNDDDDDDEFEWVSRKAAGRGMATEGPEYHHLPPHVRYGKGPSTECFGVIAQANNWQRPYSATTPCSTPLSEARTSRSDTREHLPSSSLEDEPQGEPDNPQPDVQIHLRIEHQSDIRFTLTTSMLINYPSPMFMALPIKLSVTGLLFSGEVVLAYEGSKKRVHLCILDDLDPYGPIGDRANKASEDHTPPESDSPHPRPVKPPPVGNRLLPSIFIESEIGQTDKHVLKNVTRVERFIQDVIRKTLEEELVFPNFHTLLLP